MEVYEYVSREEALSDPKGTDVGVRWVDHNKGTSVSPEVRSRLVAHEFASKDRRDDVLAATQPLAATRLLLAGLVCGRKGVRDLRKDHACRCEERRFSTGASTDTSTSGFLRKMKRRRRESGWADSRRPCMVLETRAPAAWQSEVERTMKEAGFKQSPTTPCVYFNGATNVRLLSMWKIFCVLGLFPGLGNLRQCLQNKCVIKFEILGAGANEKKAGKFLGRVMV